MTAQNPRKHRVTSGRDMSIDSNETRVMIQEKRAWTLEVRRILITFRKQCG